MSGVPSLCVLIWCIPCCCLNSISDVIRQSMGSMGYLFNVLLSGVSEVETHTHIHSAELSCLAVYPQFQKKVKNSGKSQWQFVKEVLTFHVFLCSCPCIVKCTFIPFLFCAHHTVTMLKCIHRTRCDCNIHFSQQCNPAQSKADFIRL